MALGNKSSVTHTVTFKNLKKEDDRAFLEAYCLETKENQSFEYVEGELIDIRFGTGEFDGKEYNTCAIYLRDGDQTFKVKSGWERMTTPIRQVLLRLLSLQSPANVQISFFGAKGEYKNAAVKSNGEKLEAMFTKEELEPKIERIKNKKGETISTDFSELEEFIMKTVKEYIYPLLGKNSSSESIVEDNDTTSTMQETTQPETNNNTEEQADIKPIAEGDLPF